MISAAPIKDLLPNGSIAIMPMSWADYEQFESERGDRSVPRLKYMHEKLYLKLPSFEHGVIDKIVSKLIEALLEQADRDYVASTPVTLKVPEHSGIEPDHCFWIQNWEAVNNLTRIDLSIDPPPDLAIETDITNFTDIADYQVFQIPEVWLIKDGSIAIYTLTANGYTITEASASLPGIAIQPLFQQVAAAIQTGISQSRAIKQAVGDR